jgi:hypothetical protein
MKTILAFLLISASLSAQTLNGVPNQNIGTTTPTTVSATVVGATYYVDSINGNDANAGTSISAPWKTIAKVNAATIASGSQVLFLSTGVWHEQITVQSAGITYGAYGPQRTCTLSSALVANCTNMPIIDGADVVTGWSVQSGAAYKAPYTSTASKGFVDSLYTQTVPLSLQTSIANVVSTAGSIFSDGTNVYVHLQDGSNPANHVVEVSGARSYGVNLNGVNTTTINGIEVIRTAKSGIYSSSTSTTNVIQNNVLFNIGDTLGDSTPFSGANNSEGAIYISPNYTASLTGEQVLGNWIGRMDFNSSALSASQAGVQLYGSTGTIVRGNKFATVNGAALQLTDAAGTSCVSPVVENNEFTSSQGNIWIQGCSAAVITYNLVHDSFGNGLEIGSGFQTADQTNNAPYVAFNDIHDILPAYSNGLFNGIDTNYATNGTYYMNRIYRVSAAGLTLEGSGSSATSSSGSTVNYNQIDASQNYGATGSPSSGTAYPMFVTATSVTGTTGRANSFNFNATLGNSISYGGTVYTQPLFDVAFPGYEVGGSIGNFASANVSGILSAQSTILTSNFTTASTSFVSTGLVFDTVPASTTLHGRCMVPFSQSTAANGVSFGVGNSAAPTDLQVTGRLINGTAAATFYYFSNATTPTIIGSSISPALAGTVESLELDLTLINGASPDTVTIYGLTANASDSLVVPVGAYCSWLP